jgi:hypothetical protein
MVQARETKQVVAAKLGDMKVHGYHLSPRLADEKTLPATT